MSGDDSTTPATVKSTETRHTPAPWRVADSWETWPQHRNRKTRDILVLAEDVSEPSICYVANVAPEDADIQERELANARLIAAAPELLAALRNLLTFLKDDNPGGFMGGDGYMTGLAEKAESAIAKAEGREAQP